MKQTYHLKSILLLTGFLLLIPYWSVAQSLRYAYDNAGNRVSRTLVVGPLQAAGRHDKDSVIYHEVLSNKEITLYPNLVRAGIVENPEDYLYTSARAFAGKDCVLDVVNMILPMDKLPLMRTLK